MRGFAGLAQTMEALSRFREKTRAAGFPGLHLNAILWDIPVLPGEQKLRDPDSILKEFGFDSATSYVWIHHFPMDSFPHVDYAEISEKARNHWSAISERLSLPYHPNVTVGWDPTPRTCQSDEYVQAHYPFTPTITGNTPEAFRGSLESVRSFLENAGDGRRIFNINSWNEWTEGSYLEPDNFNDMGYLQAIKRVFGQ